MIVKGRFTQKNSPANVRDLDRGEQLKIDYK